MSATDDLIDFAGAAHRLPEAVRDDSLRLLADTLAVGAAAQGAPGVEAVSAIAAGFGTGPEARVLGTGARLPASSAAFVNGFRIHCLEWDAVHEPAVVHALSVVTAALGAAIDRHGGCDPDEALSALAVGVEVAAGLGVAADSPLSFFRPATAGLIGAAIAVARLDGAPLADALGLAYSQCAGTMQAHVEGSIALPFQIANAARAAIVASDLAQASFAAPHDVLEGPFGYFRLFDTGALSRCTATLGEAWRISEVSVKPFPCGRASHAVLGSLADWKVNAGEVAAVEAWVPPLIHRLVGRPLLPVMTPAYARLCLPLLAALMITDGLIDPHRFTPATFADRAIRELAGKVVVNVDGNGDPNAMSPQRVRVTMTDGRILERVVPDTLGSPGMPLDSRQAEAKHYLAQALAGEVPDLRIFTDPLRYFVEPK